MSRGNKSQSTNSSEFLFLGKELHKLRDTLIEIASSLPFIPEPLPTSHLRLKDMIEKRSEFKPFLTLKEFRQLASSCDVVSEASLQQAIKWYRELGIVICSNQRNENTANMNQSNEQLSCLNDLFVISPKWLLQAIAAVVTSKRSHISKTGELTYPILSAKLWNSIYFPQRIHHRLAQLFDYFGVWELTKQDGDKEGSCEVITIWWLRKNSKKNDTTPILQGATSVKQLLEILQLQKYIPLFEEQVYII